MSKLIKSDLTDANASRMVTNLEKDKEDSESLIGVIQDFIDSSKEVLKGESFDAIRNHMQEYINLLQTRAKIADSLLEAIKNANQTMIDYMGNEDVIDTDKLDVYKQQLSLDQTSYDTCNDSINNYDSDRNWESLETLNDRRTTLEEKINQLKVKIDLIEKLDAKDSATYANLMTSEVELSNFNNTVGGIKVISI